jgi:uridine kinase
MTPDPTLAPLPVGEHPMLSELPECSADDLARWMSFVDVAPGTEIVQQGQVGLDMFFVLSGHARATRGHIVVSELGPGDHFGELALLGERPRAASVVAVDRMKLARLSREDWHRMADERPAAALALLRRVVDRLGHQLVSMTENVGVLLRERSLPRRTSIDVTVGGRKVKVAMGTVVSAVLPATENGALVVAALVDRKPVSLDAPLVADAVVEPLSTRSWEGREVVRRSAGLLLLEAAARVAPGVLVRVGPSLSSAQVIEVPAGQDLEALARALHAEVRAMASRDGAFVEEIWTVEEALTHFAAQGWDDAVAVLRYWRDPTVPLVTCGTVYALSLAPLLARAGVLDDLAVRVQSDVLLLEFGRAILPFLPPGQKEVGDPSLSGGTGNGAPRSSEMVVEHKAWLRTLGVESVGSFNARCITGEVSELIRAAEGFHEKRIGRIADAAAARGGDLRIICIAGPSSSGKTTFIKRLTVQLQIDGIVPRAISLDDYYVDREKTPRDQLGVFDFEALDALDLPLLQAHLVRVLAGEEVKTAAFDFVKGKSSAGGGPSLHLGPREVLMLEGIHGLNPALLGTAARHDQVFRIFIHPVVGLPLDRLSAVNTADVRLLRRIVRDRHHRNLSAAENILRWPAVRDGERRHIFPFLPQADVVFDSSLVYELSVLKVYADRYLLEVPREHESFTTAYRLRRLIDRFVTIYPDHVPPTSILREFIGGSGFEY